MSCHVMSCHVMWLPGVQSAAVCKCKLFDVIQLVIRHGVSDRIDLTEPSSQLSKVLEETCYAAGW